MKTPEHPKIYHIVHVDRLDSIVEDGFLWSDAEMNRRPEGGTTIGMSTIKQRRLKRTLSSHPDLHVGDCVPFYFCPRSVMLFLISCQNHQELAYKGGQEPIVHLESDLRRTIKWAIENRLRWAFTLQNAGSYYFEDRCRMEDLNEINWDAVRANRWSGPGVDSSIRGGKQAEFLIENRFPWALVERIGVFSRKFYSKATGYIPENSHRPIIEMKPDWYY